MRCRSIGLGKMLKARRLIGLALVAVLGASCSHSSGGGGGAPARASGTAPGTTASRRSTPAPAPLPVYGTRKCWPIVFMHGIAGFRNVGPIKYWMDVPDRLRAAGFEVYVCSDGPFASVADRALAAKTQIVNRYPDPRVKVNLIAHSMGGLDARYMISTLGMGDRVGSLTTVSTPHRGTSSADLMGIVPGPVQDAINIAFKLVGWDLKTAIHDLTTHYCQSAFNPANPDDARVAYFSWAGAADPTGSQPHRAVIDPLLWPTWSLIDNLEGENDGMVSVKSASWGQFQGVFASDHFGEIGQPLGLTTTDYKAFYSSWADELERLGFGP